MCSFLVTDSDIILGSLDELIQHGLSALRDTLQQDKSLTMKNTSIGIIGPATSAIPGATTSKKANFRVLDDEAVEPYLREMRRRRGEPESGEVKEEEETEGDAQETGAAGGAPTEGAVAGAADGDGDVQMQE
jgi:20S proteasome subunit alpha 6